MNACSSILSQLLSNNCPPGPLESGPLQAEAERLKIKIVALRKKLEEYEDLLQKHQTVLSAARKIPLDVLGIILSFVLPDCSTRADWQELTNLSLVCKDWHQAAHFAYRFTSRLELYDTRVNYDRVVSWSRRATAGRSFQIKGTSLYCPMHRDEDDPKDTTSECTFVGPALLRLLAEGPALDHLIFHDVRTRCYRYLLKLLETSDDGSSSRLWDKLKSFTLHFDKEYRYRNVVVLGPEAVDVPPCATSLDLRLPNYSSVEIGANSPPLFMRPGTFERLTFFSLKHDWSHQDGTMLLAALAHCTNLETLALNFSTSTWSCSDSSKVVKLPKLQELHLAKPQEDSLQFLNFIKTPALTHLDVFLRHPIEPDALSSFITKQVKKSPQDTLSVDVSLRISFYAGGASDEYDCGDGWDSDYEDWDIPEFLGQIPNVTQLILDNCIPAPKDEKNEDDFFVYLAHYKDTLTHLKVLEIFHFPPTYPFESVNWYVDRHRKRRADRGIETLVVKYDPILLPESCNVGTERLVEKLKNEGLLVDIKYPEVSKRDLLDIYFK